MTISVRNSFALLSDEVVERQAPAKKVEEKKPTSAVKKAVTPNNTNKPSTPAQDKSKKDKPSNEPKPKTKPGVGGRATLPRAPKADISSDNASFIPADHIKEENRPARTHSRPHREAPVRGREHDRHSATGRMDGEKKEVAGHSWGKAVDFPEGVSAEEALEIAESDKLESSTEAAKPTTSESTTPATPTETLKNYSSYLQEQKSKRGTLNALKAAPRKPNEGNSDKDQAPLKVLNKSSIRDSDSLAALLKGAPKSANKKCKKEKKEKEQIAIEPRFTFDRSQRPHRGGAGAGNSRGGYQQRTGPRSQFNAAAPVSAASS